MTKRSLYGFLLGTALIALPMGASAQAVAELMPTGQWLVNNGAAQGVANASTGHASCIMANQYNNGFILRMAGGNQQLVSLSLDFRQNAFTQGQSYPAVVSVDGGNSYNLTATAFSPGILIVNVRDAQGLYGAIQKGRSLALNVVGNTIIFSLDRAAEGLQRLESCYSPPKGAQQPIQTATVTPKPIATKPDTDVYVKRGEFPDFKKPTADDILKADKQKQAASPAASVEPVKSTNATASGMQIAVTDQPMAPSTPSLESLPPLSPEEMASLDLAPSDLSQYEPTPGMKTTAKVKPVEPVKAAAVQAPRPPSVPAVTPPAVIPPLPGAGAGAPLPITPVTTPAPMETAAVPTPMPVETPAPVATPTVKAVMTDAPKPTAMASATPRVSATPEMQRTASNNFSAEARTQSSANASQQWEAEAGENVRDVMERWSARAGVDLVWQADNDAKVARDISANGSFEDAVKQVMAQSAGIKGQMTEGDHMVPVSTGGSSNAPISLTEKPASVWQANSGDDLKLVLQTWASQNNVDLQWKADERFALNAPINGEADFTSALEAALGQFDDKSVRPVGQLNRDPQTGRMSLTIETDRAS